MEAPGVGIIGAEKEEASKSKSTADMDVSGNRVYNEDCTICNSEILPGTCDEQGHTLQCGHRFHTPCVIRWFRSGRATCPVCRAIPEGHPEATESEEGNQVEGDELSFESIDLPLHERDMNVMLREHLCYARRNACPAATKKKVQLYRSARENMVSKRRALFHHERYGYGRYVDLRRVTIRLHSKLITAQTRFIRHAMTLYCTDID